MLSKINKLSSREEAHVIRRPNSRHFGRTTWDKTIIAIAVTWQSRWRQPTPLIRIGPPGRAGRRRRGQGEGEGEARGRGSRRGGRSPEGGYRSPQANRTASELDAVEGLTTAVGSGSGGAAAAMVAASEGAVVIQPANRAGEPTFVTVSCPDQTGLGCDFCRAILDFGLCITRGGTSIYMLDSSFLECLGFIQSYILFVFFFFIRTGISMLCIA